jgi:hypothetical protein
VIDKNTEELDGCLLIIFLEVFAAFDDEGG